MASALGVRAPAMMAESRRLVGQGWTLPTAGPHRRPGGVLLYVGSCLGLLFVIALIPAH
jgi:hypothetical protein